MSSKSVSLFLIGIILGSGLGYGASIVYPTQFFNGLSPNNYKTKYDDLFQKYTDSSKLYEDTAANLTSLQEEVDKLSEDYSLAIEQYNSVSDELETLKHEYEGLISVYNETQERYNNLLTHYELVTGSAPLISQPVLNDTIRKDYAWSYDGDVWTLSLYISEQLYYYYSNRTRAPSEDYSVYVTHPQDDEYLSSIVENFREIATQKDYDEINTVNLVIAFVQSLPYTHDEVSTSFDEYPRYPLETLVDGEGDCEDTSILACALLDTMDYDVVLLDLPEHVAVGVNVETYGTYWEYEGKSYFYLETTGEGWRIGELPEEFNGEAAHISPIVPTPICTHSWTASILNHKLTLITKIKNVGTAEAKGIKLFAGFDAGENKVWNPEESNFINLDIEEEDTVNMILNAPKNVRTRIIVRVLDPWGNIMDESFSEWFNTD